MQEGSSCSRTQRTNIMASLLRPEQVEELRQIFDLFDSDGDGLLEVEEVGAIWASCGTLLTEAEVHKKYKHGNLYAAVPPTHASADRAAVCAFCARRYSTW